MVQTKELLYLGGIVSESIVDGPGIRYVVFVQGCNLSCPGCHNKQLQAFTGGTAYGIHTLLAAMAENPLLDGLTLSGGEPFTQAWACASLAKQARQRGLHVMCYSGYRYEDLRGAGRPDWDALLENIDVLVDGPFIESLRDPDLNWRGSSNQRLLHVPASLGAGQAIDIVQHIMID